MERSVEINVLKLKPIRGRQETDCFVLLVSRQELEHIRWMADHYANTSIEDDQENDSGDEISKQIKKCEEFAAGLDDKLGEVLDEE